MRVIVYSSNTDELLYAKANRGDNIVLLRDASVWCGEVELCDAVQIIGDFPAIEAAYADVPRVGLQQKVDPSKNKKVGKTIEQEGM
jgi:hypothetical protein